MSLLEKSINFDGSVSEITKETRVDNSKTIVSGKIEKLFKVYWGLDMREIVTQLLLIHTMVIVLLL